MPGNGAASAPLAPSTSPAGRDAPTVDARALAGLGELAFISAGSLWVLDGSSGSLVRLPVPAGFSPSTPQFSGDGKWLAYLATRETNTSWQAQLWLAHGDGGGAHRVSSVPDVASLVGWSPTADLVAVVTQVDQQPAAVVVVPPTAAPRRLMALVAGALRRGSVQDAAWSPDGRAVAVSTVDYAPGTGSAVRAYPVDGGAPTTWFSIKDTQMLPGTCSGCGGGDVIADLAGWWAGWGIGFWVFSSGMTHNNDDTPLEVLARPGARPHLIGETLSDGETVAVAAGPAGSLAIVDSTGGRELGAGKKVETCLVRSRTCTPVPGASTWDGPDPQVCAKPCFPHAPAGKPGSGVSLDPAWAPDGALLAYVKAPVALTGGWPSLAWYQAHDLMIWDAATRTTRRLGDVSGASVPVWARNGQDILLVEDDSLWLTPVQGGEAVEVAGPLYSAAAWRSAYRPGPEAASVAYYGQVPWVSQFNWWSPEPRTAGRCQGMALAPAPAPYKRACRYWPPPSSLSG